MMINWTATIDAIEYKKPRIIHYLSMEYLPGRLLSSGLTNVGALELVKTVLGKLNRKLSDLIPCEPDPGLGNGGLGRLASCFLDSLATKQYPAIGYGLRYQYGIFDQEIWNCNQVERPDCWLLKTNPWEIRRDIYSTPIQYGGKLRVIQNQLGQSVYDLEDYEEVRALPYDTPILGYHPSPNYSVVTLRLWSTKDSPRNFLLQRYNAGFLGQATENTSLTDVLYPNDNNNLGKRIRLKQEYLLVSASLQDIIRRHLKIYGNMDQFVDQVRIQINDTHPALVIPELMRILTKEHEFSWEKAWESTQEICGYTNHTILREGLEEWKETRVAELLPRQYAIIQKINFDLCSQVRSRFPDDEEKVRRMSIIEGGQIRMAHLAIYGSHQVNGVAELHSFILKTDLFQDYSDLFPEKFTNVTNGISQRRWLLNANPLLSQFITNRIGDKWIFDLKELKKLKAFASDLASQKEFLELKRKNKETLLQFLIHENPLRNEKGIVYSHSPVLNCDALFDVQIKRFHEYKRQLMNLLYLIMLHQEIKNDPDSHPLSRLSIFGGKAAPGYHMAKEILRLSCTLSRLFHEDADTQKKLCIALVENYNVSRAEIIIPAADLSEQISPVGWEASGTGNMKLALNGALTISTEDGSNIEMHRAIGSAWWPFQFGCNKEQIEEPYNPLDIYNQDEPIRIAVDFIRDLGFTDITDALLQTDTYRVLKDLRSYYETQKKVEELYLQPLKWAETAIQNIAGMGNFSADHSIEIYAEKIWQIKPCPPDPETLAKVREEYSQNDACRIR